MPASTKADVIIEAVFESMALKKDVLAQLDAVARPGALLATNTSTLDIDALAGATARPQAVIGTHFFSPANVMRLVEIVRGAHTTPATIAAAQALAKRLGKVGVVVGNCPGFVGNRMMFPYMYEAQFLAEDGATPAQVDKALTDWGMAMGIFAVDDMGGLDVAWRVRQELKQFSDPSQRKPLVADQLVAMNHLGQKTGSGWYVYDESARRRPTPRWKRSSSAPPPAAGITRRSFTSEEIIEREIYALVNEGAKILEEGYALRAADIDVIYLTGYGFPSFRGGPMFYADAVGLKQVYERVAAFHRSTASAGRRRRCSSGWRARARRSARSIRAAPPPRPAPDERGSIQRPARAGRQHRRQPGGGPARTRRQHLHAVDAVDRALPGPPHRSARALGRRGPGPRVSSRSVRHQRPVRLPRPSPAGARSPTARRSRRCGAWPRD